MSTLSGICGFTSYENIHPIVFAFSFFRFGDNTASSFHLITGGSTDAGLTRNFRYKTDTNGCNLWMCATGADTNNYIIPKSCGGYSNFDIVREDPPSDAVEITFT